MQVKGLFIDARSRKTQRGTFVHNINIKDDTASIIAITLYNGSGNLGYKFGQKVTFQIGRVGSWANDRGKHGYNLVVADEEVELVTPSAV